MRKEIINNRYFLYFTLCTLLINTIYFIIYLKFKFILSSLYFVFNFIAIVVFSFVFKDDNATKKLSTILKVDIFLQLIIYFLGLGKWYGSLRYMGTFNDPNQFGYFILVSYLFIFLISQKYGKKKNDIFILFISIFLIFKSASTGMLIGIFVFLVLEIIDFIRNFGRFFEKNKYRTVVFVLFMVPVILGFFIINNSYHIIDTSKIFAISRVVEKFKKASGGSSSGVSLIQERGYDRFKYYPQYVLYGSGEGEYNRFIRTYHQDEIHATFPSILFYYGILPTLVLILWIFKKIRNADRRVIIPLVAIIAESFTLLNQRQALFWVFILFVSFIPNRTKMKMRDK